MRSRLEQFVRLVLRHRALVLCLLGLVTVAAVAVLPQARFGSSLRTMFFGDDHPGFNSYIDRIEEFGSDEIFLFGLEVDDPLSDPTLQRLERFHELTEELPEVRRVSSIATLERVGLVGDTIGVRRFADEARANPNRAGPLLDEIRADPIAGGLMVAREGDDVLVLVEMVPDPGGSAESGPRKLALLLDAFDRSGIDISKVHPGGMIAVLAEMVSVSQRNLLQLFPLVVGSLLIAVWLMFGRLWPVFVTTASALIAVLWAAAFAILREPTINILMTMVPTFVMIISFSDVVHMCSAYLLNLEAEMEKREAIVDATAEVGIACFLTSITTATGFLALTFAPAPSFQHVGLASAVGVVIAYGLAIVLVPIALHYLPTPEPWHRNRFGFIQARLDAVLGGLAWLTTNRPWTVILIFAAYTSLSVYGATLMEFETDFGERLADDNPTREHARYLTDNFVEASLIDVYVDGEGESAVLAEETFARLVEYEAELENYDEIDKVVSLVDLMRATHRSIAGEDAVFGPFGGDAIAQMMVLLEMQGPDALSGFVDFERQTTRMTVYSNVHGIVEQFELRRRIEADGRRLLGDRVEIEATGVGPLMGEWLDDILAGQRRGLLFSLVVIALLLMIGFRSVRTGLVSMIPNVIPLLTAAAYGGFFWTTTDSDVLIVAMIALGIGVDDTIHFIARYQLEAERNDDPAEALRQTFRYSGRGIFITTFVFVVGFVPLLSSDYWSIWVMGFLLPVSFVVALVTDLLLVPALIRVGWIG